MKVNDFSQVILQTKAQTKIILNFLMYVRRTDLNFVKRNRKIVSGKNIPGFQISLQNLSTENLPKRM